MCFDLGGILSSGCSSDTSVTKKTTVLTQNILDILKQNTTTMGTEVSNVQDLKITIKPTAVVKCGSFNVNQLINSNTEVVQSVTSTQVDDISSLISTDIENSLSSKTENEMEMLGKALNTNSKTEMITTLTNISKKSLTQQNINSMCTSVFNKQNMEIIIDGTLESTDCNFNQEILVSLVAKQIVSTAQSTSLTDAMMLKLKELLEAETKNTSKGLNSIIDSIMSFLKQFWMYILIGVVVAILVFAYITSTPAGQKSLERMSEAGAKAIEAQAGSKV
jgi:hypothetical protein